MCTRRLLAHHNGPIVFGDPWDHDLIGFAGRHQLSHCGCLDPRRKHWYDNHGLSCLTGSDHQCTPRRLFPHHFQSGRCILDHGNFPMVHRACAVGRWRRCHESHHSGWQGDLRHHRHDRSDALDIQHRQCATVSSVLVAVCETAGEICTGKGIQGETAPDRS